MKRSISNPLAFCVAMLLSLFASEVFAGPPFVTDDPEPVEYQHWEFYVGSIDSKQGGDWSGTAPHFELNYGAVPNLQLHMIAPLAYDSPPEGANHYEPGDLELGAKYRFIQETNWFPQVGVFPLFEVPAGSEKDNFGNGHLQAYLPLWIQKSWGKWTAYGGAGYGINSFSGNGNWGFGGAVLQNQILTNVLVGVEVYHQTQSQIDFPNQGTAFNVGTVIDLSEQHHLLFSAGRSICGPIGFQCYIAYQFTFDNDFFKFHPHVETGK
ncbi:MAG TPA: hypothetical protein VGO67_15675 [Verrucomicrobiae bacterium]|jgi:hypothetical protein